MNQWGPGLELSGLFSKQAGADHSRPRFFPQPHPDAPQLRTSVQQRLQALAADAQGAVSDAYERPPILLSVTRLR